MPYSRRLLSKKKKGKKRKKKKTKDTSCRVYIFIKQTYLSNSRGNSKARDETRRETN